MNPKIVYKGPRGFSADEHEDYARSQAIGGADREVHKLVARCLRTHDVSPLTPARLVAASRPESGQFKGWADYAIISNAAHLLNVATCLWCWCRLEENERESVLAACEEPREFDGESLKRWEGLKSLLANPERGVEMNEISYLPHRYWIGQTRGRAQPFALALWDFEYGNPIAISLREYLFLRTRYPSGQWGVQPGERGMVTVTVSRKVVGGMMPYDVRPVPGKPKS